ncbi:MAG: sigma-70 family RNA polymerase sigma factor [Actinomycetota bacterium]|nr:sigma-70 family RNA polymerase sigma factor [Actinomycetota bacterium]
MLSTTLLEDERPNERFERFYSETARSMVRFSLLLTSDTQTAEDITQDAYVEVYRRFAHLENPKAYLRRCIINAVRRRAMRERLSRRSIERLDTRGSAVDQPAELCDVFAGLSLRQRTAVFLRYYLDLSEADMATTMGCRPGTVKSTLSSALSLMREALDGPD